VFRKFHDCFIFLFFYFILFLLSTQPGSSPQPIQFFQSASCRGYVYNWDTSTGVSLCNAKYSGGLAVRGNMKSINVGKFTIIALLGDCNPNSELVRVIASVDDICMDIPEKVFLRFTISQSSCFLSQ
jgi:hypothetical protein